MKSIILGDKEKECYVCHSKYAVEEHHIFGGNADRNVSEKYGLKVHLCWDHHHGTYGCHGREGQGIQRALHQIGQQAIEEQWEKQGESDPRGRFIREFRKSYL